MSEAAGGIDPEKIEPEKVPAEMLVYLHDIRDLLGSIRMVMVILLAVMVVFGLIFAVFILYDMVVHPSGGGFI